MELHTVVSMPFAENTYLLWQAGSSDAVVIDPGFEPEPVLEKLADEGLTVRLILNTHGHVDHIAGNADLKAAYPDAPLVIGAGDEQMLTNPMLNLSGLSGVDIRSPPADRLVREGDVIEAAGLRFEVLDISIFEVLEDSDLHGQQRVIDVGPWLFVASVLPGVGQKLLARSAGWVMCASTMSIALSATNGKRPHAISNTMQPSA